MSEALDWLKTFEQRAGRPLRVLHIGNIANNAYNNAKIQRAAGIEADVLSHDYYHIMACPEWEDADFDGEVGDDMFPDWWAVDLRGFERPRWFAQGPLYACLRHLLARQSGSWSRGLWWRMLTFERWLIVRKSAFADRVRNLIRLLAGTRVGLGNPFNGVAASRLALVARRASQNPVAIALFADGLIDRLAKRLARMALAAHVGAGVERHARAREKYGRELRARANSLLAPLDRRLAADDLDWSFYWWWHPYMRLLLSRYDVVQAYATYTTMPFIAGRRDFIAYEHGTIRAIPFADDMQGRMCSATYRAAAAVLVTNLDNLEATVRLQLDPHRVVCLPHAFDSGKLRRFAAAHPAKAAPRAQARFFSPSRQDWQRHDPSLSKGNDRAIRALAEAVRRGKDCRIEFIEWGTDVAASKRLIAELGLEARVVWLPKMKKRELWAKYLEADCVIDQFIVPAMGGVTFEAMMLGRRVISRIDERQARQFFGESPPLFNGATVEEIAEAMAAVATDREDRAGRGKANHDWMQRYHSQERIVDLQLEVYRRVLDQEASGRAEPRDLRTIAERHRAPGAATALRRGGRAMARLLRTAIRAVLRLPDRAVRFWQTLRLSMAALLKRLHELLWARVRMYRALVGLARLKILPSFLWRYRHAWLPRPAPGRLAGRSREIVMLVVSDLRIDPRVERAARTMASAGYRVKVIWPEPRPPFHADQPIDWGPGISFRPLAPAHYAFVNNFPWVFGDGMFEAACDERPFAFHCHDLTTVMIGLAAARKAGAYCICDFHEWYSENVSWDLRSESWQAHRPFRRYFYRAVERLVMSRADAVITVCDSIAEEISSTLSSDGRKVEVIRNIPPLARSGAAYPPLRESLGLRPDQFLLLWQGGTGPSRMIEPIIRALAHSPGTVFVIRGPSLDVFGDGYRAVAREAGAEDRLVLLPPVPSRDVVDAAASADAGVWTLPKLCKNFYYALPNKIFEYLAAGIPVLAANYPEALKMVEGNGVGLCFDPYDPSSIAAQINRMAGDASFLRSLRDAIPRALARIDAGREWERLRAVYASLGEPA